MADIATGMPNTIKHQTHAVSLDALHSANKYVETRGDIVRRARR
jgi:hypothetical protein